MFRIDAALSQSTLPAITGSAGTTAPPHDVKKAAQQFEALLLSELLRSAHGEHGGWLGAGEDSTASSAIGLAEETLAQSIASKGGLGLSELITRDLTKR